VVPGGDHDDNDEQGVEDAEEPDDNVPTMLDQLPPAPQRPGNVQRRHRGELVGEPAEAPWRARVGPPPANARKAGHRVDKSREHPGRRHRDCCEHGQAGESRQC